MGHHKPYQEMSPQIPMLVDITLVGNATGVVMHALMCNTLSNHHYPGHPATHTCRLTKPCVVSAVGPLAGTTDVAAGPPLGLYPV